VDEGDEVNRSPDPTRIDGVTPVNSVELERHCNACDRFLGLTTNAEYSDKDKCSNTACKVLEVPILKEMKV